MTEHVFISSPVNVLTGDAARVALAGTNDAAYAEAGKGVLTVPQERWQQAQQYERETWLVHGRAATEDRNGEHAFKFNNYADLPKDLGFVIEFGCGPFTNIRAMLQRGHTASDIVLVDPLADAYKAEHPHCTYANDTLEGVKVQVAPYPIEYPQMWLKKADTVILINTLTHCYDTMVVFERIRSALKKGGTLVFAEPLRDIDPTSFYDVGHPLSPSQVVMDAFLKEFKQVFRQDNYFIGTKK